MKDLEPGRLLILGLPEPELGGAEERLLREVRPGGVILFRYNVVSEGQVRDLVAGIREASPGVLLFVDAEGGRVDRFRELLGPAPAGRALASEPPRLAERSGRWIGHGIRSLGCDVDFAPVVDLDRGQRDNALADRYLGATPRSVTARGRAFLRGLHSAGVAGCVKHFPGLGGATRDTHDEPAGVDLSRKELERDLRPFRELLGTAGSTMITHATYSCLDSEAPASLSAPVVTGLLRGELEFEGLVVADDLDMDALAPWGDLGDRVLRSLEAGCDAFPICRSWEVAREVIERIRSEIDSERLEESVDRWTTYRRHLESIRADAPSHRPETIRRRLARVRRAVVDSEEDLGHPSCDPTRPG